MVWRVRTSRADGGDGLLLPPLVPHLPLLVIILFLRIVALCCIGPVLPFAIFLARAFLQQAMKSAHNMGRLRGSRISRRWRLMQGTKAATPFAFSMLLPGLQQGWGGCTSKSESSSLTIFRFGIVVQIYALAIHNQLTPRSGPHNRRRE